MIESEIAILSAIAHPNIIKLEEVFDFPTEKYLVMEYVSGGDLFDAIAHDIKYTENVARDMIKDLANALQVKCELGIRLRIHCLLFNHNFSISMIV